MPILCFQKQAIEAIEDNYETVEKTIAEKMYGSSLGGKEKVVDKNTEIGQFPVVT